MDSLCDFLWANNSIHLVSCTVSEIWRIIGLIFALDRGCHSLTHLLRVNPIYQIGKFGLKILEISLCRTMQSNFDIALRLSVDINVQAAHRTTQHSGDDPAGGHAMPGCD